MVLDLLGSSKYVFAAAFLFGLQHSLYAQQKNIYIEPFGGLLHGDNYWPVEQRNQEAMSLSLGTDYQIGLRFGYQYSDRLALELRYSHSRVSQRGSFFRIIGVEPDGTYELETEHIFFSDIAWNAVAGGLSYSIFPESRVDVFVTGGVGFVDLRPNENLGTPVRPAAERPELRIAQFEATTDPVAFLGLGMRIPVHPRVALRADLADDMQFCDGDANSDLTTRYFCSLDQVLHHIHLTSGFELRF